mmetsp:Transcript_96761/g.312461  ORF Transcript_96761/g.312461 Transcript_96761/m.312461 type:complete len:247 (-) Transcript_96761:551-1291(-)
MLLQHAGEEGEVAAVVEDLAAHCLSLLLHAQDAGGLHLLAVPPRVGRLGAGHGLALDCELALPFLVHGPAPWPGVLGPPLLVLLLQAVQQGLAPLLDAVVGLGVVDHLRHTDVRLRGATRNRCAHAGATRQPGVLRNLGGRGALLDGLCQHPQHGVLALLGHTRILARDVGLLAADAALVTEREAACHQAEGQHSVSPHVDLLVVSPVKNLRRPEHPGPALLREPLVWSEAASCPEVGQGHTTLRV